MRGRVIAGAAGASCAQAAPAHGGVRAAGESVGVLPCSTHPGLSSGLSLGRRAAERAARGTGSSAGGLLPPGGARGALARGLLH